MSKPIENIGKFANNAKELSRNPLGIIALFLVLVYGIAAFVTSSNTLTDAERLPLIYFLVIFPILVLGVFAWLVSRHSNKLYAPGDFKDEKNYVDLHRAVSNVETVIKQVKEENPEMSERFQLIEDAFQDVISNVDSKLRSIRRGYVENPDKSDLMNLEFEERSFVKKYSDHLKKGMGYFALCVFCNSDGWNKAGDYLRNFDNAVQCGGPNNHLSHGVLLLNDFEIYYTSPSFITDYLIKELFKLGGIYRIEIKVSPDGKNYARFAVTLEEATQIAELYAEKEIAFYPQSEDGIANETQRLISEKLPSLLNTDKDFRFHSSSFNKKFGDWDN